MKKVSIAAVLAALALAACVQKAPPVENTEPVIIDEECPRADGQPCR